MSHCPGDLGGAGPGVLQGQRSTFFTLPFQGVSLKMSCREDARASSRTPSILGTALLGHAGLWMSRHNSSWRSPPALPAALPASTYPSTGFPNSEKQIFKTSFPFDFLELSLTFSRPFFSKRPKLLFFLFRYSCLRYYSTRFSIKFNQRPNRAHSFHLPQEVSPGSCRNY